MADGGKPLRRNRRDVRSAESTASLSGQTSKKSRSTADSLHSFDAYLVKGLSDVELELLREAISHHDSVTPCNNKRSFKDCFTQSNGVLYFWFNTEAGTTRIVKRKIARS